jgi:hypothetical protein
MYAVSSIAAGRAETLKEFKKILVDANEWSESSKVIFYKNGSSEGERLAFTTQLSDVLAENTRENPLFVSILNASDSPVTQQQHGECEYFQILCLSEEARDARVHL